jgi:hypothetical protein
MNGLADCESHVRCVGRRWTGDLQERKGGVTLQIDGEQPFALHLLDDERIAMEGKRCDGVLIAPTWPFSSVEWSRIRGGSFPTARSIRAPGAIVIPVAVDVDGEELGFPPPVRSS